jgi:hypothetical protein
MSKDQTDRSSGQSSIILASGTVPGAPDTAGARNGSQRVQTAPDSARPTQTVCPGGGLSVRLSPTVTDSPEFPDTEEVTGSNPVRLRNKNLVHDENGWLQTWAGVAIAASGKGYNVEKVIHATTESVTLQQEHYGNMYLLVEHAISWVNSECERLCNEIIAELEKLQRKVLLNQPAIIYQPLWRMRYICYVRHDERFPARLRSGDGQLSVRARPSSLLHHGLRRVSPSGCPRRPNPPCRRRGIGQASWSWALASQLGSKSRRACR